LVLVIVAVLVVAAVAGVTIFILSQPQPPPSGPTLASVALTVTPGSTLNQTEIVTVTATALDSAGKDQTTNATWTWSATPSAALRVTATQLTYRVQAKGAEDGQATITAQASLAGVQKSGSATLTIAQVRFTVVPRSAVAEVGVPTAITVTAVKPPAATFSIYAGRVRITSSDPGARVNLTNQVGVPDVALPAEYTFTAAAGGIALFPLKLRTAGPQTVTVADLDAPTVAGSGSVRGDHRPDASFTNTTNPSDGRIITFTSTSTDVDGDLIASFSWEFGDGTTQTVTTPSVMHAYTATRIVQVNLTVTDIPGLLSNETSNLAHPQGPPVASFKVDRQSPEAGGVNVTVNATLSADIDGGGIAKYNWTWDDGTFSELTAPITYHVYGSAKVNQFVNVTLRVTDDDSVFGAPTPHSNASRLMFQVTVILQPPVAVFTSTFDDVNLIVMVDATQTSDPNGDIALLNWTWGDGQFDEGPDTSAYRIISHQYLAEGDYQITLTVTDSTSPTPLSDQASATVSAFYAPQAPIARFTVTKAMFLVDVDASGTTDVNNDIVSYEWDFEDDGTVDATGPLASHTYPAAGVYTIALTVTDSQPASSVVKHKASVAASTLDYTFYDFFNVPYKDYWDKRGNLYGDLPIGVTCFNESAIVDYGNCAKESLGGQVDPNTATWYTSPSYTNWWPSPGSEKPWNPNAKPFLFAPYRFDVRGANVPGYNVSEPVFLPVFNYNAQPDPDSFVDFDWKYFVQTEPDRAWLRNLCGVAGGGFNDGFDDWNNITLTMDLQSSKRIFNVDTSSIAAARNWWSTNTDNSCSTERPLEAQWGQWLLNLAGDSSTAGKYDVATGCEWYYLDVADQISAVVDNDGVTHVTILFQGYCTSVLISRWFYWGNTSYRDHWDDSTLARGWWGMELAWFEDMVFSGRLSPSAGMDFNFTSVLQYHFQMEVIPGPDGILTDKSGDDIPVWVWRPVLNDYIDFFSQKHDISELDRHAGQTYRHTAPGSPSTVYDQQRDYDYVPIVWSPKAGEEWHFRFPTGNVIFYDPRTAYNANPVDPLTTDPTVAAYIALYSPFVLQSTRPTSFGDWDAQTKTWDVYGPVVPPLGPDGSPGNYATDGSVQPKIALRNVTGGTASLVSPGVANSPVAGSGSSDPFDAASLLESKLEAISGLVLQATLAVRFVRRESR